MAQCPKCGAEVEAFYKKKRRGVWLACPNCKRLVMKVTEAPPDVKVVEVDKFPWEEEREEKVEGLFEAPKEPSEVVAEVLTEYGCSEEFVKAITKYIERKGYVDAQWLFNMLLKARTGRRFTEEEAFLVVDEIVSAIESERRKAESVGRPFPLTIVRPPSFSPPFIPSAIVPTAPAPPQYYAQPYPPSPPSPPSPPMPQPLPTYQPPPQAPQPTLTREAIEKLLEEKLTRALAEKRMADEISELRRKVTEDIPKLIDEKVMSTQKAMMDALKEKLDEIKSLVSSLESRQAAAPVEEITKKDLELLQERLEKSYLTKLTEAERKALEERLKTLESKIEEKVKPIPPPSEGYKEDSFRLVADTIKTLVKPGEWYPGKAVSEVIIKLVPPSPPPPPERRELPSEKSIVDKIREAGGTVE